MWSHLNTLFFGGIFPFVTFLTAAWDCEIMSRRNDGDSCPLCLPMLLIPVLLLMLLATILILIFCIRPKYKARKAMRENRPKSPGDLPMEGELYANICKAGTGHFQEIHYATPVFQEGPREQEACHNCKTGYVYSELLMKCKETDSISV
ncbi:allergin-1 isoform X3 [Castor canadensis]|uniref:Allergin-1 isoform X3 n=1 Tax=Castor canadensis TaxID=51338 RepID=A0AC58K9E1_CASCN